MLLNFFHDDDAPTLFLAFCFLLYGGSSSGSVVDCVCSEVDGERNRSANWLSFQILSLKLEKREEWSREKGAEEEPLLLLLLLSFLPLFLTFSFTTHFK